MGIDGDINAWFMSKSRENIMKLFQDMLALLDSNRMEYRKLAYCTTSSGHSYVEYDNDDRSFWFSRSIITGLAGKDIDKEEWTDDEWKDVAKKYSCWIETWASYDCAFETQHRIYDDKGNAIAEDCIEWVGTQNSSLEKAKALVKEKEYKDRYLFNKCNLFKMIDK